MSPARRLGPLWTCRALLPAVARCATPSARLHGRVRPAALLTSPRRLSRRIRRTRDELATRRAEASPASWACGPRGRAARAWRHAAAVQRSCRGRPRGRRQRRPRPRPATAAWSTAIAASGSSASDRNWKLTRGRVRQTPGSSGHDILALPLSPPHLAPPGEDEPDLLDRPVGDRRRGLAGREREVGQAATGEPQEDPHLGSVRRDRVALARQAHRRECLPCSYLP